tara:strand:- start:1297 stop:1479 length:183 start_codon:yes stop_codon:yes gene_type:complete
MNLLERFEFIKKNIIVSKYAPGSLEKIFEYNERCALNEDGTRPIIIVPEKDEKKKKKIIN